MAEGIGRGIHIVVFDIETWAGIGSVICEEAVAGGTGVVVVFRFGGARVHVAVDAVVAEDMAALFRQLPVFEKRGAAGEGGRTSVC